MVKKKQRHWVVLSLYYPPEIGAPQIRLRSMVKELKRSGLDVEVLTAMPNYPAGKTFPDYEGRWYMREEMEDVKVRRSWVYAGTGKSARIRLLNYFSFTLTALLVVLLGPRPDVLFVESQPLSLGIVAVLMKWLRGVPYIYNVPDLQVDVARQLGFMRNEMFLRISYKMENLFLRQSWKISTVTDGFIEHFVSRGIPRNQITFLPNGADSDFLQPQPVCQEMVKRWQLEGKKVFVYVGTHAFYHGLDTLIEAADLLKSKPEIVFLLVGDGPERERLKQMAVDLKLVNVVFGQSPYDEMDRLYSIAYASIATLRDMEVAKTMRLSKVFPSLSCKVPVIYSGKGEAAQLLVTNKCGIVTYPEDSVELADAVAKLADNSQLRDEMGNAGRVLIDKEYSWRAIVSRWMDEIGSR